MKKTFMQLALLALLVLTGSTATAQSIPDVSEWSFSSSSVTIDGNRYYLDKTNMLAEFSGYYNSSNSSELSGTVTIPSTVNDGTNDYTVVSVRDGNYYKVPNVTKLVLPSTLVRLNDYALDVYSGVELFEIPASVKYLGNRVVNREYAAIKFLGTTVPEVSGKLSPDNKVKVYVPAAAFQEYKVADYIEDCCVISDDLSKQTFSTGTVDSGELGYIVVANQLPDIIVYSDVNKLIVDAGTLNTDDWYQLRQMKNLISLDLSGLSITEVPYEALRNCWQIETVILPPTLEAIHGYAFYRTGIRDLVLPSGLTTIDGSYNFYDCDYLTSIDIPEGVVSLPNYCFQNCSNLQAVNLSSQTSTLGDYCFESCDLRRLSLPGTLAKVPYQGFSSNRHLTEINFGEGIESIGEYSFNRCDALPTVSFPKSLRKIAYQAFASNESLATIELNEGLEEIDDYAFSNAAITEIALPSSLVYLLNKPFSGCTKLKKISSYALIPPTVRSILPTSSVDGIDLYVPMWSFQEYMTTPGWLEYQDRTHVDPNIQPENIVINKEFEFVLTPGQVDQNYHPNVRMLYNSEQIDDGFGHQKYERGNLTVSSRSTLSVNNFSMYVSPYAKCYSDYSRFNNNQGYNYDNNRTTFNANALVVKGSMRADNQSYTLLLCNDKWQFISFPFDVNVSDIQPVDPLTQWTIRRYDGAARAAQQFDQTWVTLTQDDVLEAGKGYIIRCYNNGSDYRNSSVIASANPVEFTLRPIEKSLTKQQLFNSSSTNVALEENISEFDQNRSWNLIGNPYPCFFDTRYLQTESPFLVWDSYNGTYAAFSPVDDDYVLEPSEAFFIQRPASDGEQLTFWSAGRQTYRNPNNLTVTEARGLVASSNAKRTVVNLVLSDGEKSDRTRVVFNDAALMKYETGRDAAKFMAENDVPQLWSVGGTVQYAINERPVDNGVVELAVSCPQQGQYTISLGQNSNVETAILEDRLTGTRTELTLSDAYTFNAAEAGTQKGRFFLAANGSGVLGITSVEASADSDDSYYNLAGQRVSANQQGLIIKNGKKVVRK